MISERPLACLFVSDLHGRMDRYATLVALIREERPCAVFLGGDLFPHALASPATERDEPGHFIEEALLQPLRALNDERPDGYPRVLLILGNDDSRDTEGSLLKGEGAGVWEYIHGRTVMLEGFTVTGYNYVPPTPFMLKDWERYDVSRYVDPGCISPEEGRRSVPVSEREAKFFTIASDLDLLSRDVDFRSAVFLFHSPPYGTALDMADLHGKFIDHAPLDPHVGSIAIRRFLEAHQPPLSLHGHVHESSRLTGAWKEKIGSTVCLSAAYDGPGLAVVRFELHSPWTAEREIL